MNIHPESRIRERPEPDQRPETDGYADESEGISLSSLIWTVWDNRWLLIATTALGLGWSVWYLRSETPLYTATAEVVLESEDKRVVDIESVVPQRSLNFYTINTELRAIRAQELMLRTVDALSLDRDPEFNPALRAPPEWKSVIRYDRLRSAIGLPPEPRAPAPVPEQARKTAASILQSKTTVSDIDNTFVFTIAVQSEAPEKSAEIANTLAEAYVASQREKKFEAMDEAMGWLGTRVVELKTELEAAEAAIEDYAASATLVSEETLGANQQRLKSMRARQGEMADEAAELRSRIERLEALRAARDFATLSGEIGDSRLRAAAETLATAEGTDPLSSSDPRLVAFDARFGVWLDSLRDEADRAENQVAAASRSVDELESQVDAQSHDVVTLRQMQREAEATRLIYESFLSRLKELSVQQGIQQADARIMSPASRGYQSHPHVNDTFMRGGVIGLMLGLVLMAVRNVLRNSILTPEELEATTGLTAFGVIPDHRFQRDAKLLAHIVEKPTSGIAESIRSLVTAVQLSNIDATPQVVVVTSSVPDEGKSILAAAIGQTTALSGKKVLVIDSDLRRKMLREYFDLEARAGMVSLLSGQTSFENTVYHDERTGLDLIVADDKKVTPVDFFGSQHFADFIAEMRKTYDLIVLDTPPALAVPDARVIAQHADAVIYAVRWHATTRRMVRTGLDLLRQANVGGVGLALTRVDPRRMDRYGYYGYGYGYGYGSRTRKLQKYYSG